MVTQLKWLAVIVLLTLGAVGAARAKARITVSTDQNPVSLDQSFQITFKAHGSVDGSPDFSPLNKDFQVLSTGHSSKFQIINGHISSSKSWNLTVLARHTGKITIPPISFGADRSPPYTITVAKGGAGNGAPVAGNNQHSGASSGDIFLEVQARPLHSYVQAQVIYTVRLYRAVGTNNASLSDPEVAGGNAIVERIGQDKNYRTVVNGRSYGVVERSYAIFPQKSGSLTIEPVHFRGEVGVDPFSIFDPFGAQSHTLVRESAPVKLDVKPVPDNYANGQWLPATKVTLTESWSQNPPKFQVGEPITRTLTLTADGLSSSQLPDLPDWVPDKFRAYPDQPVLSDKKPDTGIIGQRVEKTAVIPTRPGKFVLPKMRVPWWNVSTHKVEYATLPERDITVAPAATGSGTSPAPAAPKLAVPAAPAPKAAGPAAGSTAVAPSSPSSQGVPWQWISLGLAIGWLLSFGALWWWRRRPRYGNGSSQMGVVRTVRELKRACTAGDASAAKQLLLQWAALTLAQPPRSIGELAARSRPALARELQALNRALYAPDNSAWNGQALWQAFEEDQRHGRKRAPGSKSENDLEPLYRL